MAGCTAVDLDFTGDGFVAAGFFDAALFDAALVALFFGATSTFFTAGLAVFVGAAVFDAAFFTGDLFAVAFLPAVVDVFDAGFAAFFAAGLVAFFAAGFFAAAFSGFATAFFAADFTAAAGFFFFFESAAFFDVADLLALDDLAFAVLSTAFFVAGLAVDAFGFGDGRFMVNSSGRWTWLCTPCDRIQRERIA